MDKLLIFIGIEIIVILMIATTTFFLLWRSERSYNHYRKSFRKGESGERQEKSVLLKLKKMLLKELKSLNNIVLDDSDIDGDEPLVSSVLKTRRLIVKAELAIIEDMLAGSSYRCSLMKHIKVLLTELSELYASHGTDVTVEENHTVITSFQDLVSELDNSQIALSREIQHQFESFLESDFLDNKRKKELSEIETSYGLMIELSEELKRRNENLSQENERLYAELNDIVSVQDVRMINVAPGSVADEQSPEDPALAAYMDLTQRLIDQLDSVRSEKNRMARENEVLEQRQTRDEKDYHTKLDLLNRQKQELIEKNSHLISRLNSLPNVQQILYDRTGTGTIATSHGVSDHDRMVIEKLNGIDLEKISIAEKYQLLLDRTNKEKASLSEKICSIEEENLRLTHELDRVKKEGDAQKIKIIEEHKKALKEKEHQSSENTKKTIKKLNKIFEFSQTNAENLEKQLIEKDKTISTLTKKLANIKEDTEGIISNLTKNYSNLLHQKDARIKRMEKTIDSLKRAIGSLKI
jgi:hypothetical protein